MTGTDVFLYPASNQTMINANADWEPAETPMAVMWTGVSNWAQPRAEQTDDSCTGKLALLLSLVMLIVTAV